MQQSLVPPCQPCSQTTPSVTMPTCVTASRIWCLSSGWDFGVAIRHHYISIILFSSKSLILFPLSVTRQEADGSFGLGVIWNGVLQSGVGTAVPPGESGSSHHPAESGLTWSSGPARLYHQVWNTGLHSVPCGLFLFIFPWADVSRIVYLFLTETCLGSGYCRQSWLDLQISAQHTCAVSFCLWRQVSHVAGCRH